MVSSWLSKRHVEHIRLCPSALWGLGFDPSAPERSAATAHIAAQRTIALVAGCRRNSVAAVIIGEPMRVVLPIAVPIIAPGE